ncbi:nucleotidyltransferase family protein [Humibacillus xanthopallidus]|uniref:Nicotine blue oxidoreductase n=1 Tax=Humibacillus xanthopallidus TaxID=412689 RepID=A0A543I3C4_9MICO|nr:nucleotidyltransferase family protein [Humibacillus xanthopallidus]TQM65051.1 nicotine blue oxidoreductase [Humibacillus xanthopallidus]
MSESLNAPHPAAVHGRAAHVRGLVLAAGAGKRMGGPKALLRRHPDDPTLVEQAVSLLHAGGCTGITVVVGAAGQEVSAIVTALGRDVDVVPCPDWHEGMGASLRAGLTALTRSTHEGEGCVDAVLVTLVDLPDLTPEVVARVLDAPRHVDNTHSPHPDPDDHSVELHQPASPSPRTPTTPTSQELRATLRRAAYDGVPGHPALIGRAHWDAVIASAVGDHGARHYFRGTPHELVECGDLATGRDADTPEELGTSR